MSQRKKRPRFRPAPERAGEDETVIVVNPQMRGILARLIANLSDSTIATATASGAQVATAVKAFGLALTSPPPSARGQSVVVA